MLRQCPAACGCRTGRGVSGAGLPLRRIDTPEVGSETPPSGSRVSAVAGPWRRGLAGAMTTGVEMTTGGFALAGAAALGVTADAGVVAAFAG